MEEPTQGLIEVLLEEPVGESGKELIAIALTFGWPSPNLANGNRIACGVPITFLPEGKNCIGKNRKAGETPARARHCNWGVLQHGICFESPLIK